MNHKITNNQQQNRSDEMVFGLDRATDEQSLESFVQSFADSEVLGRLIPRLEDHEIEEILDFLTALMKKHLSETEYHQLFLGDR